MRLQAVDDHSHGRHGVQDYIAAGQFRVGEQLIEAQNIARPGTILVFLEPLDKGGLDEVTAGSSCIVNAYTSNHDLIASGKLSAAHSLALHTVDAVVRNRAPNTPNAPSRRVWDRRTGVRSHKLFDLKLPAAAALTLAAG